MAESISFSASCVRALVKRLRGKEEEEEEKRQQSLASYIKTLKDISSWNRFLTSTALPWDVDSLIISRYWPNANIETNLPNNIT